MRLVRCTKMSKGGSPRLRRRGDDEPPLRGAGTGAKHWRGGERPVLLVDVYTVNTVLGLSWEFHRAAEVGADMAC